VTLELHEILDRYEILYPEVTALADLRRSVIDKDLNSIFRLSVDNNQNEELRKAIVNKNIRSICRLLENNELGKLIEDQNMFKLPDVIDQHIKTEFTTAFKSFMINKIEYDKDCFSRGQLLSKQWLVTELEKLDVPLGTVFLCAGWYATLATMLFESNIKVDKIRSFDIDPNCAKIAEVFNKPWFEDNWRFKASNVDIMNFNWSEVPAPSDGTIGNFYYMTDSNSKQVQMRDNPDTIINTSCEHISNFTEWYNKIPNGKVVVLQSNNYFEVDEHVNCSVDLEDFSRQIPMSSTLYEGELQLEKYTRFMKIGYK
jgi:ankyrin repeat protein